jgi:hypothetical protein
VSVHAKLAHYRSNGPHLICLGCDLFTDDGNCPNENLEHDSRGLVVGCMGSFACPHCEAAPTLASDVEGLASFVERRETGEIRSGKRMRRTATAARIRAYSINVITTALRTPIWDADVTQRLRVLIKIARTDERLTAMRDQRIA